jgi:hypothetical protein
MSSPNAKRARTNSSDEKISVDIVLKLMDGSTIDITMSSAATVWDVKKEVEKQNGKPISSQLYYIAENTLRNAETLANLLSHSAEQTTQALEIVVQISAWSFDHFISTPFSIFNNASLMEDSTTCYGSDCDHIWLSGPQFPKDGVHSFSILIEDFDDSEMNGMVCVGVGDMAEMGSDTVLCRDMRGQSRELFDELQQTPPASWFLRFEFGGYNETGEFGCGSLHGYNKPMNIHETDVDDLTKHNYEQPIADKPSKGTSPAAKDAAFSMNCGSTITIVMDRNSRSVTFSLDGKLVGSLQNIYPPKLSPIVMCTWANLSLVLD